MLRLTLAVLTYMLLYTLSFTDCGGMPAWVGGLGMASVEACRFEEHQLMTYLFLPVVPWRDQPDRVLLDTDALAWGDLGTGVGTVDGGHPQVLRAASGARLLVAS